MSSTQKPTTADMIDRLKALDGLIDSTDGRRVAATTAFDQEIARLKTLPRAEVDVPGVDEELRRLGLAVELIADEYHAFLNEQYIIRHTIGR